MIFFTGPRKTIHHGIIFRPSQASPRHGMFFFAGRGSARAHSHKESSMDLALPSAGWLPGGMACFFFALREIKNMPCLSRAQLRLPGGMA